MNTYNIKIDRKSLNKLATGLYNIKGYTDTGVILELKSDIKSKFYENIKIEILDLINPMAINERIDIIKNIAIELEEELAICTD